MPQEEHDVRDHSSYPEEVAARAEGLDTICDTFREGACGLEECLEPDGGMTDLAGTLEGAVLMLEEVVLLMEMDLRLRLRHEVRCSQRMIYTERLQQ